MTDRIHLLADEIQNDPLARGYAGMTDEQLRDSLNAVDRSVPAVVTVEQVRQYLITQINGSGTSQRSSLDLIREFADLGTVRGLVPTVSPAGSLPARQSACLMVWFMLRFGGVDGFFPVDNTNVRAQFISIGPDSGNGPAVLTAAQLTALDALAVRAVSRGVELGIGAVAVGDIQQARLLIA